MLTNLPGDGRSEKSSKSKLDFELPRIAPPTPLDAVSAGSNTLRFHWLTLPRDYSRTALSDIDAEYTQLRRELLALNEQAARTVERMTLRGKPQRVEGTHLIEVRSKEADNNAAIIGRLRAELEQLQRRVGVVSETGKDSLDDAILQTREEITALRHKNKQLQQKSKEIGCSIEAGDEAFSDLKKLQVEVGMAERKRGKLQARWKETAGNLERVGRNLSQVTGEAHQAESYIEEQLQSSRVEHAEHRLQSLYRQHNYNLEALRKNEESVTSLKQQKYHQRLKQLEEITARIETVERNTINAEQKHIQHKEQLVHLEERLKEAIQNAPTPSPNFTREEKENEKSPSQEKERLKQTVRVSRSTKLKEEGKPQAHSQYGRMSYEQEPTKNRLLNLRINKSVSRKAENKANHTIDALPAENPRVLKKKSTVDPKAERPHTINHTNAKAAVKVNSVDFPEKETSTPLKVKEDHDYFLQEEINEEIHQSIHKEQPTPKKQSHRAIEEADKAIQGLDQAIEGFSQPQTPTKSHHQSASSEQQQESDADLLDFKKSIAAELTGPYTGVGSISIALGEIESSIRKHESKKRLHRGQEEAIAQQEEQPLD